MNKKVKKFISKGLIVSILFANMSVNSLASILSEDTRYETLNGNYIKIDNILEKDTADIEVYGETLVNLAHGKFKTFGNATIENTILEEDVMNSKIVSTGSLVGTKSAPLKDNTTYTLICDLNTNLSHVRYSFGNTSISFTQGLTEPDYTNYTNGYTRVVKAITTTTDCISVVVGYHGVESVGKYLNIKNLMLLEGDWTNKEIPEYFKDIKSVGQIEDNKITIKAQNKNLLDTRNLYSQDSGGNRQNAEFEVVGDSVFMSKKTSNGNFVGAKIKCKKGQKYTIGFIGGVNKVGTAHSIYIYSDKLWGTSITTIANGSSTETVYKTITATTDELYVGMYLFVGTEIGEVVEYKNVFVYEGESAEYEKYQENSTVLKVKEPLRSLPSGVKDRIVKMDGKWMIERNCKEIIFDGSSDEYWSIRSSSFPSDTTQLFCFDVLSKDIKNYTKMYCDKFVNRESVSEEESARKYEYTFISTNGSSAGIYLRINNDRLNTFDVKGLREWLSQNPVKVVCQLSTPVYESLQESSIVELYEDITYISNTSSMSTTMKVTVDRVVNRAKEFAQAAKDNPTVENISQARYWINLMKDSMLKDEFQNEVNEIDEIENLDKIEKKTISVNTDVYIKMKNGLSISLDTNSISFKDYTGSEDMEMLGAINITVNSTLPYSLNAYMPTGIYNSDKTKSMNINVLNIREGTEGVYKQFVNTTDKIVLKENCEEGENNIHAIDLKLSGSTHKADVYKTVLKFEAEQN